MMILNWTFVVAIFTISILSIGGNCCSTGKLEDNLSECCFNYFKDGHECKACPAGYYGKECSTVCSEPYFGFGCTQKCECLPCHHIHGCRVHDNTTDNMECSSNCSEICIPSYVGPACIRKCNCTQCHHTNGCNQTLIMEDKTAFESEVDLKISTQTANQEKKNAGRLLIISAGSAVSLTLILIIIYELYKYRYMSNPTSVHHVANDVNVDIAVANDQCAMCC